MERLRRAHDSTATRSLDSDGDCDGDCDGDGDGDDDGEEALSPTQAFQRRGQETARTRDGANRKMREEKTAREGDGANTDGFERAHEQKQAARD